MSDSLIQQVVALEAEADRLIRNAHEKAKTIEEQNALRIAEEREQIQLETLTKIEHFKAQAEQEHRAAVEQTQAELTAHLARLGQVSEQTLVAEADQVLSALVQDHQ